MKDYLEITRVNGKVYRMPINLGACLPSCFKNFQKEDDYFKDGERWNGPNSPRVPLWKGKCRKCGHTYIDNTHGVAFAEYEWDEKNRRYIINSIQKEG